MLNNVAALFGGGVVAGDYESIQTYSVAAGGVSSVSFSSIPSIYKHLQVRAMLKSNTTGVAYVDYTFNGVGGTSYSSHYLFGNGSTAGANAGNGSSASSMYLNEFPTTSNTNMFGVFILDILDYANTSKYKTTRALGGNDKNGSGVVAMSSGLFMSNNAISSITFTPQSSAGIGQYSHFALYGIKG